MDIKDKKAMACAKADLDLHLSLIMRREKVTKAKAMVVAYAGGPDDLQRILSTPLFAPLADSVPPSENKLKAV